MSTLSSRPKCLAQTQGRFEKFGFSTVFSDGRKKGLPGRQITVMLSSWSSNWDLRRASQSIPQAARKMRAGRE